MLEKSARSSSFILQRAGEDGQAVGWEKGKLLKRWMPLGHVRRSLWSHLRRNRVGGSRLLSEGHAEGAGEVLGQFCFCLQM